MSICFGSMTLTKNSMLVLSCPRDKTRQEMIAYSMGQVIKSVCICLCVSVCVCLWALSRSHFLIDFYQNWHRLENPKGKTSSLGISINYLVLHSFVTHSSFIHSFIKPLDRRWVVVPSLLLHHWLCECPMWHQRRVLCRLPVVASADGEAGHVDVSTAACCRGGDQFLPWQPDAVPCVNTVAVVCSLGSLSSNPRCCFNTLFLIFLYVWFPSNALELFQRSRDHYW